jgi:hypothetical protein
MTLIVNGFIGGPLVTGGLGYTGGGGPPATPFYLPYEYGSTVIKASNTNAFGIDPEATTIITVGLTSAD